MKVVPRTRDGVGASCVSLPAGAWPTTLDFLVTRFPAITRPEWVRRMVRRDVTDDEGEPVTPETPFTPHRKIYYYRSVVDEPRIPFEAQILFQDEHIVVADKPHFLPVMPAGRFVQETLLVRLKKTLGIAALAPVHRIDRDTAGLVLFTIQPQTRDAYCRMFRERSVEKRYEAIARIAPLNANHTFPIIRRSRMAESDVFMQMHEVSGDVNAETHIAVMATRGEFARFELCPVTGRKHQLRVHMAALGLPIMNDRIYPELQPPCETPDYEKPLQLLAKKIFFTDPLSGEPRAFTSERTLLF